MRASLFTLVALLAATSASAAPPPSAPPARPRAAPRSDAVPGGPRSLGKFEDWTAAAHDEAGQNVCYAFTIATQSTPAIPGRDRVVMTVAERPSGRDSVAISAGFAYAQGADAALIVDQASFPFYTAQRSAFARDGQAAVAALLRGRQAQSRSPGPRGTPVVDTFSLRGMKDAYAAVQKACPAR